MPRTSNNDVGEKLDRDDAIKAQRLLQAINEFREIESAFPASYMAAFLLVALRPGGGPTDYAKYLQTIPPIASRMLLEVGERQRNGKPGCGLIERHQSIEDFRQTHYTLTPKGKKFLRKLLDHFGV